MDNPIVCVTLLLITINTVHGFCQSDNQLSTVGVEQNYYDEEYGRVSCCELVYPVLFSYITCINTTLTTEQQLAVESNADNAKYEYIKFEQSRIPLVPVGVFTAFTSLAQLYLNNSVVENVHPGAFTGLTSLENLYLQNNKISRISRGTLNSLRNLKLLDLSNNNLETIEEHAFLGLSNLQNISLSRNNLKNLLANTFDNLNQLEIVDLSRNHLLDILPKLYKNLRKLHQLNLSCNNLTKFDFFFLPYDLKRLNLDNNQIGSILNWPKEGNLEELDLSHNVISNLSHDSFVGFINLNNLYLQNNHLVNIPVGCFRRLKFLNQLNLSHNEIAEFEFGTYSGLVTLKTLDISYNKLSKLYESSLHSLTNLEYLNINDNFITTFDPFDLLHHTTNLKNIWIENNPWNCKSLVRIVKAFEQKNVSVSQGSTEKSNHIYGIPCLNSNSSKIGPALNSNSTTETLIQLLRNISKDINDFHNTFNKKDFQNSSLFMKYFENNFRNSTLFQYFNQDVSNITFFRSLNQMLLKLFERFESLDSCNFRNSSLFEFIQNATLREELSNYLENVQNYKIRNETGELFHFLKDFRNISKTPNCTVKIVDSNQLKSSLFTDNNFLDYIRDLFANISELQKSNIVGNYLMAVAVIILFIIMALLMFGQFKTFCNFKSVTARQDNMCQPNEALELI